jgi:muramidase (phage lysozyme)
MRSKHLRDSSSERWCSTALLLALPLMFPAANPLAHPAAHDRPVATATQPAAIATVRASAPYRITPERRALLDTIRYAEGTWRGGSPEGYRTLYGGGRFVSFERHPDTVVVRTYASAAAGAYQFLPTTWEAASRRLGLKGFGPANQDQVALHLVEARGALAAVDRGELCDETMHRLSPEWASFPTHSGGSAYGQPAKSA